MRSHNISNGSNTMCDSYSRFNYFEWKYGTNIIFRSKGLHRIIMGRKVEPNFIVEKAKWFNKMDEAYGLLCLSISLDIQVHFKLTSKPNEVWTILERIFGKQDSMQGRQLENILISLSTGNFDTIKGFLTKLKALVMKLKLCGLIRK